MLKVKGVYFKRKWVKEVKNKHFGGNGTPKFRN